MNIILLSGGSGKRLWPLSNDIRSKQFIKIFKKNDGSYESMLQMMYRQIKAIDSNATITIATSRNQVSSIHNQLGNDVSISVEPCRRDTFPAIALSAAYSIDVLKKDLDDVVIVCPVDPYVDDDYFIALKSLSDIVSRYNSKIVLMGIEPTYPSEKYGYIIPETLNDLSIVSHFKEKPSQQLAREYIEKGALWNAGVFAFKYRYILEKAHELIEFGDYWDLYKKYYSLAKISFDYAVLEREKGSVVKRFSGKWMDLGTWNTLTEAMEDTIIGNAIIDSTCNNVHVINEMNVPVLAMGLNDIVVSASPDGILVSDKFQSSFIKPYVDKMNSQIMYAEKSWGNYKVLDIESYSTSLKIVLNPGQSMKYHSHVHRDEIWIVLSGNGHAVIDGRRANIATGSIVSMKAGCKHTVFAETELKMMEIQIGYEIYDDDKVIHDM